MSLRLQRQQASKEELIRIAAELFAERGVEATSLADIAAAAGMTTPALYHYFANRRDLEREAMRLATWSTVANVTAASEVGGSPVARLRALTERHVAFLERAGAGRARFVYWSVIDSAWDAELASAIDPGSGATTKFLRELVEEGQREGEFRSDLDAGVVAELLESCFTGIDYRFAVDRGAVAPREAYAALVEAFVRLVSAGEPVPDSSA
jgi:TetR/AcrR family transcriptional regulator